jgi:hypothetical protein
MMRCEKFHAARRYAVEAVGISDSPDTDRFVTKHPKDRAGSGPGGKSHNRYSR